MHFCLISAALKDFTDALKKLEKSLRGNAPKETKHKKRRDTVRFTPYTSVWAEEPKVNPPRKPSTRGSNPSKFHLPFNLSNRHELRDDTRCSNFGSIHMFGFTYLRISLS